MTDEKSVRVTECEARILVYLENCIQRKSIDDKNILYIKTSEVMLLTTLTIQSEENRLK